MCRHLAYLGPAVSLAELVLEPPHSLLRQSYAPRDMRGGGTVNADGFGVGWYPPGEPGARARATGAAVPMWTDASLADVAGEIRSGAVLAAVRNATAGMPVGEGGVRAVQRRALAVQPQRAGQRLARVTRPAGVQRCPSTDLLTLDAPTDAALLWALVRHRLRAGAAPADAVASVVTEVAAAAPQSRLNLLLTDGQTVVGTDLDPRPVDPPQRRPRSRSAPSRGPDDAALGGGPRPHPARGHPHRASPPVHLDDRGWS